MTQKASISGTVSIVDYLGSNEFLVLVEGMQLAEGQYGFEKRYVESSSDSILAGIELRKDGVASNSSVHHTNISIDFGKLAILDSQQRKIASVSINDGSYPLFILYDEENTAIGFKIETWRDGLNAHERYTIPDKYLSNEEIEKKKNKGLPYWDFGRIQKDSQSKGLSKQQVSILIETVKAEFKRKNYGFLLVNKELIEKWCSPFEHKLVAYALKVGQVEN